jgi:hypothetical protein
MATASPDTDADERREFIVERLRGNVRSRKRTVLGVVVAADAEEAARSLMAADQLRWPFNEDRGRYYISFYHPLCARSGAFNNVIARAKTVDEPVAIEAAERELAASGIDTDRYGPFTARLNRGIWEVTGTRPKGYRGVVPSAKVRITDGAVVRIRVD